VFDASHVVLPVGEVCAKIRFRVDQQQFLGFLIFTAMYFLYVFETFSIEMGHKTYFAYEGALEHSGQADLATVYTSEEANTWKKDALPLIASDLANHVCPHCNVLTDVLIDVHHPAHAVNMSYQSSTEQELGTLRVQLESTVLLVEYWCQLKLWCQRTHTRSFAGRYTRLRTRTGP
jgi:hypothetical protein